MNLGRAKTILIYAFLGLNLFLCYHLFGAEARKPAWTAISASELRHVEEALEEKGYMLEAKIDRSIRRSAFLMVTPSREMERLLREHFRAAADPVPGPAGEMFFEGEGAVIKISHGGAIEVNFLPGIDLLESGVSAGERELAAAFERFLQDSEIVLRTACFDFMTQSGDSAVLHYVQTFEGRTIYSSYLKAALVNNTLVSLDIYWLDPGVPHQEREMEVIPVTEALLRLIEVLGPSPQSRRIIKADLGYYSREYDAEEWELPPVWRFVFDNGEACFINAFTGNLEPETSN